MTSKEAANDLIVELFNDDEDDDIQARLFESNHLAYIKTINVDAIRALGIKIPSDIHLPPCAKLYALHAADGTALGIAESWASAYSVAVLRNLVPLHVH